MSEAYIETRNKIAAARERQLSDAIDANRKSRWALEYFVSTYGPDPAGMALDALNSIDRSIAKAEGKQS